MRIGGAALAVVVAVVLVACGSGAKPTAKRAATVAAVGVTVKG